HFLARDSGLAWPGSPDRCQSAVALGCQPPSSRRVRLRLFRKWAFDRFIVANPTPYVSEQMFADNKETVSLWAHNAEPPQPLPACTAPCQLTGRLCPAVAFSLCHG